MNEKKKLYHLPVVCCVSKENKKAEVNDSIAVTHGVQLFASWFFGKCSSSRSPCVRAINHHIRAKANHEPKKAMLKILIVHLHCESTKVVKISWRYRSLCFEVRYCTTLQSPFLKITLRRVFWTARDLYDLLQENLII